MVGPRLDTPRASQSPSAPFSTRKPHRAPLTAMPPPTTSRKGQVIKFNNEPHLVIGTRHRTPGNLRAFTSQIKMRNLRYGKALDQRFASTDSIEVLPTDRKQLEVQLRRPRHVCLHGQRLVSSRSSSADPARRGEDYPRPRRQSGRALRRRSARSPSICPRPSLKIIESADGVKATRPPTCRNPRSSRPGS